MGLSRRKLYENDIEARLIQWAREYGLGGEKNIGWPGANVLHKAGMPLGDRIPPGHILTDADRVQNIVAGMEKGGRYRQAMVLRCDYFRPGLAMDSRLAWLTRVGQRMSKATYETNLREAKAFVEGALYGA